ncbi:PIN-like domain-containing protein [Xanthomonas arboricola]|uniref:PIN-like domain-containing protein n=1 Tax=Xanthomonas arboricola TaxID=56448 RepID=UPI0032E90946
MKNLFPGYVKNSIDQREIWGTSLFVFDTNVLLNAYRYKRSARDALLNAIKSLGNRAWIPYHVALEYHRGRLSVIATQISQFDQLQKNLTTAIDQVQESVKSIETRHSLIDCSDFLKELDAARVKLLNSFEELKLKQQSLHGDDPILIELEEIFDGKVGDAPSADRLREMTKEAADRFAAECPPGFKDASKKDKYFHNGQQYHNSYGDYFLWTETLTYCRKNKIVNLILITDDTKEDWIRKVSGQTIGPRPELIEEARLHGINNLEINSSTTFAERTRNYLDSSEITNEIVQEISEQSHPTNNFVVQFKNFASASLADEFYDQALNYLVMRGYTVNLTGTSDGWLTATSPEKAKTLVHMVNCKRNLDMISSINILLSQALLEVSSGKYDQALIFVNSSRKRLDAIKEQFPAVFKSIIAAESSNVFFGFSETSDASSEAPLDFFSLKFNH